MVKFTDAMLKGLKGESKQREIRDDLAPLFVTVQPSGARSFVYRWKTTDPITKKQKSKRLILGYYPSMSLSDARTLAIKTKIDLKHNKIDPVPVPVEPVKDTRMTVAESYVLYMGSDVVAALAAGVIKTKQRSYDQDIGPAIGHRALLDITYEDIEEIVKNKYLKIMKRPGAKGVGADRIKADISAWLTWSKHWGRAFTGLKQNPMADMPKMVKEIPNERFFTNQEVVWFFEALPVANGHAKTYELLLRTAMRRNGIADLRWSMVHGDRIILPKDKNHDPHICWLTPHCQSLIGDRPDSAKDHDRVFAANPHAHTRPVERLRARMKELAVRDGANAEIEPWSLHTLRKTANNIMAGILDDNDRSLISPHTRDRILNHRESSTRSKHYEKYDYYADKKHGIQLLNIELDKFAAKAHSSQSTPLTTIDNAATNGIS